MSKGSGRRPQDAADSYVESEWERIFGRPICVLTSDKITGESYYEEARSVGDEIKLHQEKIACKRE